MVSLVSFTNYKVEIIPIIHKSFQKKFKKKKCLIHAMKPILLTHKPVIVLSETIPINIEANFPKKILGIQI